ncbi:MAG: hypothetical protein KDA87_02320 [Planctomycetales bacterium]|nr:hypothetical protein [Planctomycetales bacterium]
MNLSSNRVIILLVGATSAAAWANGLGHSHPASNSQDCGCNSTPNVVADMKCGPQDLSSFPGRCGDPPLRNSLSLWANYCNEKHQPSCHAIAPAAACGGRFRFRGCNSCVAAPCNQCDCADSLVTTPADGCAGPTGESFDNTYVAEPASASPAHIDDLYVPMDSPTEPAFTPTMEVNQQQDSASDEVIGSGASILKKNYPVSSLWMKSAQQNQHAPNPR